MARIASKSDAPKRDLYAEVTNQIVEAIEAGAGTFELPWQTVPGLPRNIVSKQSYRGINTLLLWLIGNARGYTTPLWATYKQWSEMGCQVRKGEKAAMVVFLEIKRRQDRRDGRWWRRDRASADCTRLFRLQRGPG